MNQFTINLTGHVPVSDVPGETLPAGTAEDIRKAFERAILALRELDPAIGGVLQGPSDDGSGFVYHVADVPDKATIAKRDKPAPKKSSKKSAKTAAGKKAKVAARPAARPQRKPTASRTARKVERGTVTTTGATGVGPPRDASGNSAIPRGVSDSESVRPDGITRDDEPTSTPPTPTSEPTRPL